MARLRLDADKYGGFPSLGCLQCCGEFKAMGREHPVIVISSHDQGCRVVYAWLTLW
jgi:hypothetical protein